MLIVDEQVQQGSQNDHRHRSPEFRVTPRAAAHRGAHEVSLLVEVVRCRGRIKTVYINSAADIIPFTWSVVIPVKVLTQAKSRLARLGGERRAGLALAMAADTVTAVLACQQAAHVIVITDD